MNKNPTISPIIIYGTKWCGDCHQIRRLLDQWKIIYTWIDLDADSTAGEIVKEINHGYCSVPTMVFPDGTTLTEPDENQLREKLKLQPGSLN